MRVVHLCFHGIGVPAREREPGESRYWVSRDLFLRAVDEAAGRPDVRLSFDDGNASDVETALPALRERGLRATFFPLAGRLGDADSVDQTALRRLVSGGMDVGSHGWSHMPLRGLTDAQARRELYDARARLQEAAGCRITALALPLGRYDRVLLARLRAAGYSRVLTSDRRPARDTAWLQHRYSIGADDTVDTVRSILDTRPSMRSARNALAGVAKRMR